MSVLASMALVLLGSPQDPAGAVREARSDTSPPFVIEGFVLGPSGAPAVGAVVASSAGGRAVTQRGGSYRLEVRVPRGAESVQLSAIREEDGRSLVAGTSVQLSVSAGFARVGPLALDEPAGCHGSWSPTFGGVVDRHVLALAVFDDGGGPALFGGGLFTAAGGELVNGIARWNGSSWSALDGGVTDGAARGSVFALAVETAPALAIRPRPARGSVTPSTS